MSSSPSWRVGWWGGGNASYHPLSQSCVVMGVGWGSGPYSPFSFHWASRIRNGSVVAGVRFDRRGNQMHVNLWLIWVDDFTCKRWLVIMRHFERTGMLIDSLGCCVPGTSGVVITGLQHYSKKNWIQKEMLSNGRGEQD